MIEFSTRMRGIPCQIRVTRFIPLRPGAPARYHKPTGDLIDPGSPDEPAEIEYEVLDQRGRPAPWIWLEREIDRDEDDRIREMIIEKLNRETDYD